MFSNIPSVGMQPTRDSFDKALKEIDDVIHNRINRWLPYWVPVVNDGTWWQLWSSKHKLLSSVIKMDGKWSSWKACCNVELAHNSLDGAKCRANSVVECTECLAKRFRDWT